MPYRIDFPIFKHHPGWIYLDSAATTHKPQIVIDAVSRFYAQEYATVRRSLYRLSATATYAYEQTRRQLQQWIHAASERSVVFTKGATESINIVAQQFVYPCLQQGDEIVISAMEHHANLIPWQQICQKKKARLRVIPIDHAGNLDKHALQKMLHPRVKMLAVTHLSNVLGVVNDIAAIVSAAKVHQIPVLVDAAQSILSHAIHVEDLGVDFLVFSGHKMFAPTGIGVLYAKTEHLNPMQPFIFGGEIVQNVCYESTLFAPAPQKFEAGTPNISAVMGLSAALNYIQNLGQQNIYNYIQDLTHYSIEQLQKVAEISIIGQPSFGVISFTLQDIHPHDIATILDSSFNIAIRAGQHCAQPLMDFLDIPATVRVSLCIYNQKKEVDMLIKALRYVIKNYYV